MTLSRGRFFKPYLQRCRDKANCGNHETCGPCSANQPNRGCDAGRSPWGGFVHDGCVVADDTGGGIDGNQLDLFVGRRGYYLGVSGKGGSHAWAKHVPVFDGTKICERKGRKVARKAGAI